MYYKIGIGATILVLVILGGVWFFQNYQIVPRENFSDRLVALDELTPVATSTETAPAVVASTTSVQFVSAVFTDETASYTIKIFYPEMKGGEQLISKNFNGSVLETVNAWANDFRSSISSELTVSSSLKSFFTGAYDIKEQNERFLSVLFSAEQYVDGAAHPSNPLATFNFDLKFGQKIALKDLFAANAKYLEFLSDYCSKDLLARNEKEKFTDKAMIKSGTAPKDENFSVFNILEDGLLITFPEYQVASYVAGTQTVKIPWNAIRDIISSAGPAGAYLST